MADSSGNIVGGVDTARDAGASIDAGPAHPPHDHAKTIQAAAAAERTILLSLIFGAAIIGVGVQMWRARHAKSFQLFSLGALWLFPAVWSAYNGWWRFVLIWLAYSAGTGYILARASKKPLARETPKLVYKSLSALYNACFYGCVGSYVLFVVIMIFSPQEQPHRGHDHHVHINAPHQPGNPATLSLHEGPPHPKIEGLQEPPTPMRTSGGNGTIAPDWLLGSLTSFMLYGLYFNVVTRDVAEVAAQWIGNALGYFKKDDDDSTVTGGGSSDTVPEGLCALCGTDIYDPDGKHNTQATATRATPVGASAGRVLTTKDDDDSGAGSSASAASSGASGSGRSGARRPRQKEQQLATLGRRRKAGEEDDGEHAISASSSSSTSLVATGSTGTSSTQIVGTPTSTPSSSTSNTQAGGTSNRPAPVFQPLEDVEAGGDLDDDFDEDVYGGDGFFGPDERAGVIAAVRQHAQLQAAGGHPFVLDLSAFRRLFFRRPVDDGRPVIRVAAVGGGEQIFKLPCNHTFHHLCIKGWVLVGKKNSCPCCNQRVDLGLIAGRTIWGKPGVLWAHLLSAVRWMVVWIPLLFFLVRFVMYETGTDLKKIVAEEAAAHRGPNGGLAPMPPVMPMGGPGAGGDGHAH